MFALPFLIAFAVAAFFYYLLVFLFYLTMGIGAVCWWLFFGIPRAVYRKATK